ATIVAIARQAGIKAPAIIVVGRVVELRERLRWFEDRPLLGRNIVVTRARAQASDLVANLTELGANCLEYPTIRVEAVADMAPLDRAIQGLASYDWIVFTSVNGVRFFFERLFALGFDVRALHHMRTAVIGPVTAERLLGFGLRSDIMPVSYRAESVLEAFRNETMTNRRVLLPRAAEARPVLPEELAKMGAEVDEVVIYRARQVDERAERLLDDLRGGRVDLVTFTSSSTVRNFRALLPDAEADQLMARVRIASIGPVTTKTAESLGFNVDVSADEYTIPGLCQAIQTLYAPNALHPAGRQEKH
nr:uroporphyrinogen-III synthase [Desulfobacterales bacterium]